MGDRYLDPLLRETAFVSCCWEGRSDCAGQDLPILASRVDSVVVLLEVFGSSPLALVIGGRGIAHGRRTRLREGAWPVK